MAPASLKALVSEPFGPYLEEEVLTDIVPGATAANPRYLEGVLLEWGGFITG